MKKIAFLAVFVGFLGLGEVGYAMPAVLTQVNALNSYLFSGGACPAANLPEATSDTCLSANITTSTGISVMKGLMNLICLYGDYYKTHPISEAVFQNLVEALFTWVELPDPSSTPTPNELADYVDLSGISQTVGVSWPTIPIAYNGGTLWTQYEVAQKICDYAEWACSPDF